MKRPLAIAAICAGAVAQDEPQQLEQTGQTRAFGGDCRRIVIAPDQRHALTVGEYGDLVWWDLRQRSVLRYIAPQAEFVTSLAIHPDGSWLAFGSGAGDWHGRVFGADLRTGQCFKISDDYASRLAFDKSGAHLAVHSRTDSLKYYAFYDVREWRLGCPKLEYERGNAGAARFSRYPHRQTPPKFGQKFCASPNGKHHARWDDDALFTPSKTTITTASSWLTHAAIADDGTLLISDAIGQIHLLDACSSIAPQVAECPPFAPHRGHAARLVFSRDGRHLAILGLAAVRIVDLQGHVELARPGSHLVEPGADGGEFWLIRPDSASRWNAATATQIGDRETWSDVRLHTLAGDGGHEVSFLDVGAGIKSVWHANQSCIADASKRGASSLRLRQWRADGWRDFVVPIRWRTPVDLHSVGDPKVQLLHTYQSSPMGPWTELLLIDRMGDIKHRWRRNACIDWFAVDKANRRIWFSTDTVRGLDANNLSEIHAFETDPDWVHGVAWKNGQLLITDGSQLQVVDPIEEKVVRRFARPADLAEIDLLAASPDRSHIAIADGCDVRILKVPD